jgi:hypothetical protein
MRRAVFILLELSSGLDVFGGERVRSDGAGGLVDCGGEVRAEWFDL